MSRATSGARVAFSINGSKVAFANAINYTVSHDHQPVDVLDQLDPAEYAETGYRVTFSATMFRVANQSAIALGIRPKFQDILLQPELSAELIDRVTGQTLLRLERVKCTEESMSIDSRTLGSVTLNFVAIKMSDEAGA